MDKNKYKRVYITTALPYVNSVPHVGFTWEILISDAIARYFRIQGKEVLFLTGSDENSFRIALAAKMKGITVNELTDKNSGRFKDLKKALNLSFDTFFRTSTKTHHKGAQKIWQEFKKEDVYRDYWSAWYCLGCESFYQKEKLINGKLCPEHLKELEYVNEDVYFLKFSNYKEKLIKLFKTKDINVIPSTKTEEVVDELKSFHDFNISRHNVNNWGVKIPEKGRNEVIYAFLEALTGYINGIGYVDDKNKFNNWWNDPETRIIQVIGKGITKFHTIYWPVILLSAGLRLPTDIFIHEYLTANGQKISKSLGNTIDPFDLLDKYSSDQIRFFFFFNFSPFIDGDFSTQDLEKITSTVYKDVHSLLLKGLGKLKTSKDNHKVRDKAIKVKLDESVNEYQEYMEKFNFQEALKTTIKLLNLVDEADDFDILKEILLNYNKLVEPFMPKMSEYVSKKIRQYE